MSVYNEFSKVWSHRFPGSGLPAAWEEDVRANLSKHIQRVAVLKEELEKEEFYVEYLQRLLEDVEKYKRPSDKSTDSIKNDNTIKDLEVANEIDLVNSTEIAQNNGSQENLNEKEILINDETFNDSDKEINKPSTAIDDNDPNNKNSSQYVTVIEVNGCLKNNGNKEKRKAVIPSNESESPSRSNARKVPPPPPPKYFRKGSQNPADFDAKSQQSTSSADSPPLSPKPKKSSSFSNTSSLETDKETEGDCQSTCDPPISEEKHDNINETEDNEVIADDLSSVQPQTTQIVEAKLESPKMERTLPVSQGRVGSKIQELLQKMEASKKDPSSVPVSQTRVPSVGGPRRYNSTKQSDATRTSVIHENEDSEPLYDCVAPDVVDSGDYVLLVEPDNKKAVTDTMQSGGSSSNDMDCEAGTYKSQTSILSGQSNGTTSSATTDTEGATGSPVPPEGGSPKCSSNYVNIDFFLKRKSRRKETEGDGGSQGESLESDDDLNPVRTNFSDREEFTRDNRDEVFDVDSGVYSSSVESTSAIASTPPTGKKWTRPQEDASKEEAERLTMYKCIINSIIESERIYVDCLSVMLQYMKALKSTLTTSQPVLTQDEFSIIFYKLPELHSLHQSFFDGLLKRMQNWDYKMTIGDHFKVMASKINIYGSFLQNYGRAIDTVRQCCLNNAQFADITKVIRLPLQGQPLSLEDLLHKPVARVQKNALVLHDLIKYTPESHPDNRSLKQALKMIQCFLNEFNMMQTETLFPTHDRAQRHLVKNSFIVELSEGHRKLRHLFLFNDVMVCAKYKASGRAEKYTFELKWYIPLSDISILEEPSTELREASPANLVSLKSQACTVRDQIIRQESREERRAKLGKGDKQKKKLAELEAQLVLASPNLVFRVGQRNGKTYTFFLSSEFERSQWIEAVHVLEASQPSQPVHLNMDELQAWITACRKFLKTNMGSYLLQSSRDETLLVGDLHVLIQGLQGLGRRADLYVCLEVDSYGHYFRKAKTKMVCDSIEPVWNEDFIVELEGSQNLRILLYEENQRQGTLLRGKATLELSRNWLSEVLLEQRIPLQEYVIVISLKFTPSEKTLRRVPTGKPSGLFGAKISQVGKREKRDVPFIITSCVREVEKRGMNEVGIYRVSGSASDVSRLKKAYETNSYEAEQMLKEVDIHSVTGILKMYVRELPEALFTDDLYPPFFNAFSGNDYEARKHTLLQLFSTLPQTNQSIILFLLDHMVKVNQHENHNKMSLHNLATVFGPNLLRPGSKSDSNSNADLLAAGTVDVMAQAGILYFFLTRRAQGEYILENDKRKLIS